MLTKINNQVLLIRNLEQIRANAAVILPPQRSYNDESKYFVLIIIWCTVSPYKWETTTLYQRERVQRAITFRGLGLRAISFFRASKTRKEKSSLNTRQNNAAVLCNAKYEDSKEI